MAAIERAPTTATRDSQRCVLGNEFHASVRAAESLTNCGAVMLYRDLLDTTLWLVAGRVIGSSAGRLGTQAGYILFDPPRDPSTFDVDAGAPGTDFSE